MLTPIYPANAAKPAAPYSPAMDAGDIVFFSGQIALTPEGALHNDSLEIELDQIFINIDALLSAVSCQKTQIPKVTIFLTNMDDYATVNQKYGEYMSGHAPARTTVQVAKLPLGARVEIEVIVKK